MTKRILAVLLVACGGGHPHAAPTPPPPAESVTFALAVPAVGATLDRSFQTSSHLDLAGIGPLDQHRAHHDTVEVVAASDAGLTRAKVTYTSSEITIKQGAQPAARIVDPLGGKSYLVDFATDPPAVSGGDGAPVAADQAALVASDQGNLATGNRIARYLSGRTVTVGDVIAVPADQVAAVIGSLGTEITGGALTLRLEAIEDGQARFAIDLKFTDVQKDQGVEAAIAETGQLWLDPGTPWRYHTKLAGPVTLSGAITGTGTSSEEDVVDLAR